MYIRMSRAKYTCEQCNKQYSRKSSLDQHTPFCKFIHTPAKDRANIVQIPSQEVMFQYMIHLTQKYEQLEQKLAKIEMATGRIKKTTIEDTLRTMAKPVLTYNEWLNQLEITDDNLQKLFDYDLKICIKSVLEDALDEDNPFTAFQEKPNIIYIYDEKWRMITAEEFSKLISVISHRILKKYMSWANENREKIDGNTKFQELAMSYMSKANGLNCNLGQVNIDAKKWMFSKMCNMDI